MKPNHTTILILYYYFRGEIRFAVTPRKALLDFIKWLKEGPGSTSVLCSYNNRNFDSVILKKNMEFFKIIPSEIEGNKKDISIEIGKGFGDAMDILKELKCKGMVEKDTYFQKHDSIKPKKNTFSIFLPTYNNIYVFLDPNIKSTTDMQIPLEYLCEIQIPPNCVRDAISDARYTGLICDEAATRLGYEDFDEFLIDNPQNLFGIN